LFEGHGGPALRSRSSPASAGSGSPEPPAASAYPGSWSSSR
jgi:hypothetical protein